MTHLYISPNGNDKNEGTITRPLATLQRAGELAVPGTTVHAAPGIYIGHINTKKNGTREARIRFVSDERRGAVLMPPKDSREHALWRHNGSYTDIDGFEMRSENEMCGTAVDVRYASNVAVMNCHIHDFNPERGAGGGAAIVFGCDDPNAGDNRAVSNVIHDIAYISEPKTGWFFHGVYHETTGVVQNNLIYRIGGFGLHNYHAPRDLTVTNNTVCMCRGGGFVVGNGDGPDPEIPVGNIICANNIFRDCGDSLHKIGAVWECGAKVWGRNRVYLNNCIWDCYNGFMLEPGSDEPQDTVTADPGFKKYGTDGYDFALGDESPCGGAGTVTGTPCFDLSGNTRTISRSVNIGCM